MKRKILITISAAAVLLLAALLMGCSRWDTPYTSLDKEGYTVSVRFDANGGVFAGTKDVFVVDVFNLDSAKTGADGKKEISLLTPDDAKRGDSAFEVSKSQYFLAGWYRERKPRVNDAGEPLDDYGVLTSVSGRPQGYEYAGKWDFATDKLKADPNADYSSEESLMTLYAAWIPYFVFEFYAEDASGNFTLLATESALEMTLPVWNEKTGVLDMKRFPEIDGKTLTGVYADSDLTVALTDKIGGAVDYEKGISATEKIKVYTTWKDGEWVRIYTAKQFYQNSRPGVCFELMADLDFEGQVWSPSLAKGKYTGILEGNGHTIANVTVPQADIAQMNGGLFGSLEAGAVLRNVTFENITYTMSTGSRLNGASFGLLAGSVNDGAVLENVQVSGKLQIDRSCYPDAAYSIGLLFGTENNKGVDISGISCELVGEDAIGRHAVIAVDAATGRVQLTFETVE